VLASFLLVSFYYDSRSIAVLSFLAGLTYTFSLTGRGVRFFASFGGKWGLARLLLLIVAAALLLNAGATALFSSDLFLSRISSAAAQKYKAQASGTFGLLLGGRSDLLVSVQAFLDEPLLGHGSWPKDTQGYSAAQVQKLYELGYPQASQMVETTPWIPTHSYLMGALVWSGIIGGLFWIALLYVVLGRFMKTKGRLPLYFYIGTVGLVWDVLFSPFGASARWNTAVFLAAFLFYTHVNKAMRVDS